MPGMSRYIIIFIYIVAFCPIFIVPHSVFATDVVVPDEERYARCLDMTVRAPDKAINNALVWQTDGGGAPARHCEAVGLFHLGEYGEAAMRLELIAEDMRVGKGMPVRMEERLVATAPMLADMYGQAANAWLLADEIVRAEDAIAVALSLTPKGSTQELDLKLDRARIFAADGDFEMALKDLEHIQAKDQGRMDILILIASAARGVSDYAKAEKAIDAYLAVFADDPAGHLERGNLYGAMGHLRAASQSWLKVLQLTEVGTDADAARANLEQQDMKKPSLKDKKSDEK